MLRYKLRTLLLLGMVLTSIAAAAARFLESYWFAELTDWHGGGGLAVEDFAREVAARLLLLPPVFAIADICVAANVPSDRRLKGFWFLALAAYATTLWMCNSAILFAQSARE